ncbi:MAG: hypothetical protein GY946_14575 [bacterium]|nr:hypothetical protein [bacterium]
MAIAIGVLGACAIGASADNEVDDGIDVYFRDVDLGALTKQALPAYPDTEAGESKNLDRAFPGAPPQIPHTVEDMLPILADDNECLNCHHPDNTTNKKDMPLTDSHFQRAVMGKGGKGDAMVWVVKSYKEVKDAFGSRYNCTMCHTPQASNVDTPKSTFKVEKAEKTEQKDK